MVCFFIGCSTHHYKSNGVEFTKDISLQKDEKKVVFLEIDSLVDEIQIKRLKQKIISELEEVGYQVINDKSQASKQLYIEIRELNNILTTQNSKTSLYNIGLIFFEILSPKICCVDKVKYFREIPVYILTSKIKVIENKKEHKTKIIAEQIEDNKEIAVEQLEKKLSQKIATLFKEK